jgi:integrase
MESALGSISVLLRFMALKNENIEKRFYEGQFLQINELDAIRDFCQIRFRTQSSNTRMKPPSFISRITASDDRVGTQTEYVRLTVISQYTKWLAEQIIGFSKDRMVVLQIKNMEQGLKARRPAKKSRNANTKDKGLDEEQITLLFELFRPQSNHNPFKDKSIRSRNRLIFLMLYHLGLRGGELLNIRIRDIDFSKNQLVVARRADEKDDPRKYQPLVKTLDRRLPMKDTLVNEIHHYVMKERRGVPNAVKHDFLFITHKSGPTQGQPLSKSGYNKVMEIVRQKAPSLYNLTGHQLRHSWNELFSNKMDAMNEQVSQELQEKMRSHLMGWKEGSGTSATYNKRFIQGKAKEASLKLQNGMVRLPMDMTSE